MIHSIVVRGVGRSMRSAPMRIGVNANGDVEAQWRRRHLPPATTIAMVRLGNNNEPRFQLQLPLVADFGLDMPAHAQRPGTVALVKYEIVVRIAVRDAIVRPRLILGGHQAQQWRAAPCLFRRRCYYYQFRFRFQQRTTTCQIKMPCHHYQIAQ